MAEENIDWTAHLAKAQASYEQGIKLGADMSGWNKLSGSSDQVTAFSRVEEGSSHAFFKAEIFLDKPTKQIAEYCMANWGQTNMELQPDDFVHSEVIARQGENVKVMKERISAKGPVNAREIHMLVAYLDLGNDTYAMTGTSVDMGIEPAPDHVLGDMKCMVMTFEPVSGDANRTHLTSIVHVDPKGNVPSLVTNAVLGRRVGFWEKVKPILQAL